MKKRIFLLLRLDGDKLSLLRLRPEDTKHQEMQKVLGNKRKKLECPPTIEHGGR